MTQPNYAQILQEGPFPNHIDAWVEQGQYFHPLHNSMITFLLSQINRPLIDLGYVAGRETSLQIAEGRIPDAFIEEREKRPKNSFGFQDYAAATEALNLELGLLLNEESPELDALFIRDMKTGDLVTVIELVSPSNKVDSEEIEAYQARRKRLLRQAVNIVEIDLTRSIKRLVKDIKARNFPYHIAVYLHSGSSLLLGMGLTDTPKTFSLPLRAEVFPVHLAPVYEQSYRELSSAWHIQKDSQYTIPSLPFPSTLSSAEQAYLMNAVKTWQGKL